MSAQLTATSMLIDDLLSAYRSGRWRPAQFFTRLLQMLDEHSPEHAWITRVPAEQVLAMATSLEQRDPASLPLYGVPFAIKDNIDLAGVPTTAACPDFAYVPAESAYVVQRLIDAGAILVGKTNLDQFATGLVGTRSPYGAPASVFSRDHISGGSSSGSAVVTAAGLVSFALGTDTAGSGRVPAAFNNIVGLKPTRGRLSTRGVVPACRSLDCVSIFAGSAACAERVLAVAGEFDGADPYARATYDATALGRLLTPKLRIGVPRASQREFFGDDEYARLFEDAIGALQREATTIVEVDIDPFLRAAKLLYEGPWVAERYVAIEAFLTSKPEALHPVTREIISKGAQLTAADAFRAQYQLEALRRAATNAFADIDVLLLPTAGTIYRLDEVHANPVRLNSNLGHYTNFVNLLDLAAIAVPAGFRSDGLPFGITFMAPAGTDEGLLQLAARVHPMLVSTVGATTTAVPLREPRAAVRAGFIPVVACGAHMSGLPLNHQLTERGSYLVRALKTAPSYQLFALAGGPPYRPGLVRVAEKGRGIDVEVWAVPAEHFGSFVAGIPAPLGIGKVRLEDGTEAPGFLCEAEGLHGATEITHLGSWRTYLQQG